MRALSLKGELFEKELLVLRGAKKTLAEPTSESHTREQLEKLVSEYEDLLNQTKVLAKIGDKLHKKMNKANEQIAEKNRKLEETLELLLAEKAGRQAIAITMIFFLVVFILTEIFIDPSVELWAHEVFPTQTFVELVAGLSVKIAIALTLRPIEYVIEKFLIRRARNKRINSISEQAH